MAGWAGPGGRLSLVGTLALPGAVPVALLVAVAPPERIEALGVGFHPAVAGAGAVSAARRGEVRPPAPPGIGARAGRLSRAEARMRLGIEAFVVACLAAGVARGSEMLRPGDPFPKFELPAHDGTVVRSQDLAGRAYLIYFYPKAGTPGCTREACAFRDAWDDLRAAGLVVLGVSYDTPEANRRFAERYHLPFRLLSDADRRLARAVGAERAVLPVPRRISYLVGPDGRVVKAYPEVRPARHAAEVLADARAAGLVASDG